MDLKAVVLETLRTERRTTRDAIAALGDGAVSFRPTGEQMSFGAQALHLISCQATLMQAFQGKGWNWNQGIDEEHFPTLPVILARFDEMHQAELAFYEGLESEELARPVATAWGEPEPMLQLAISFLAHESHHRGQLVVYLRLMGMTPPRY